MAAPRNVERYFSKYAAEWLAGAYGYETLPQKYPVGANRMRLAIQAILQRIGSTKFRLIDLGCGGGELCIHVAQLGAEACGIDFAEGMISEAKKKRKKLSKEVRRRLTFTVGSVLDNNPTSKSYDAATALGLIEYLPEDSTFFAEARRLLKPGGVLVVSCRNRLFNMASLNEYTGREVKGGSAGNLLYEIASLTGGIVSPKLMAEFARKLKLDPAKLEEAVRIDLQGERRVKTPKKIAPDFGQPRRQHTPHELEQSARAAGFIKPAFYGVHPHPLPPSLEVVAPRFYNHLASVFEVFEGSPVSLLWSSAFIGVFSKPK